MFDTVILVTGAPEQEVLGGCLKGHNPQLRVIGVETGIELLALNDAVLVRSRLIGFCTPVIVPPRILDRLGFGAYNFHPGPPAFPGLSPAQFAIYHQAQQFGATVHRMAERVDAGPIVAFRLFDIRPDIGVEELELMAYRVLAQLFWMLAEPLAVESEALPSLPTTWAPEKSSRRRYEALCAIPTDIAKDELDRRVAAFGGGYFGVRPTITLHGHTFQLVPQVAAAPKIEAVEIAMTRNVG